MSNDCLVKKYKATVNDNSLIPYGAIRVKVNASSSPSGQSLKLSVRSADGNGWTTTHVKASDGILFGSTDGATDLGNETTVSANGETIYFTNANGYIDIYNKKNVNRLRIDEWGVIEFKLSDLKYMYNLRNFGSSLSASYITGDLLDIAQLTLQSINIPYSKVTGNVIEVGTTYPYLTGLNIGQTQGITGTLEGFVEAACTVGSPRTVDFMPSGSAVTFHENPITTSYKIVIDANGATVKNPTLTQTYATYTKSTGTWTYA